jgi:hypothetical protein
MNNFKVFHNNYRIVQHIVGSPWTFYKRTVTTPVRRDTVLAKRT